MNIKLLLDLKIRPMKHKKLNNKHLMLVNNMGCLQYYLKCGLCEKQSN